MEIRSLINPLLRWWWLIVASTVVAMISSAIVTLRQPPIYQSRTTLIIGRTITDPNPSSMEFNLSQQLARAYAQIATRDPIRNATMEALGLPWLPAYSVTALPDSQIIQILVTDTNPIRAQAVANELARQIILQSPTAVDSTDVERQQFVNDQLNRLQSQISQTQGDIERLQEQLGSLTSARQIQDTQNQINSLQTVLNTLQSNYSGLLSNTGQGATNTLSVIEAANRPSQPIGPNKPMTILLAGAIGMLLASTAAYGIEFLDDTIKSSDDLTHLVDTPIIGRIGAFPDGTRNWTYVSESPRSPIADSFRILRTNLDFADAAKPRKVILVSSSSLGEGKTTIACNLAAILSQADRKVILVDGDLRRPMLHNLIEKTNQKGLSDIFRDRSTIWEAITPTLDKNVSLISSGPLPPNPTELLASHKMDEILGSLREIADIVIIDGPPYMVPDASVLADKVDGVILVVRPRFSRRGHVKSMYDQIQRMGAEVLGIVMNGITRGLGEYEMYYEPYGYTPHLKPKGDAGVKNGAIGSAQRMLASFLKKEPSEKDTL